MNNDTLKHYGVKGMKWGRRRYVREDGTLTEVSKAKIKLRKDKRDYNKALFESLSETQIEKARNKVRYSQKDLKDAKTKYKLNLQKEKPKRQSILEARYIKEGMSKEKAEIAAYQRHKTEKIILAVGALTVAAAGAYATKKYRDKNVDKIFKSGKKLRNISTDEHRGIKDAFYASTNNIDGMKYRGLYGIHILSSNPNAKLYEQSMILKNNVKVASPKTAEKVLKDLSKDKEYINELRQISTRMHAGHTPKQAKMIRKAKTALDNKEINADVYELFNNRLVDHSPDMQKLTDKFYKELKNRGYDAIVDINDSKYSGYRSKNPLIVFNGESVAKIENIRNVGLQEVIKNHDTSMKVLQTQAYVQKYIPIGAGYVASILGVKKGIDVSNSRKDNAAVQKYKKEHPGTKLGDTDILRMLNEKG